MIECDNCGDWFHYECVNIKEGFEPEKWYCEDCDKIIKKSEKPKKKKKLHN